MKEFLKSQRVTYNLMSFTAFKSLLRFSYLLEQPRSYEEIHDHFASHSYLNETISIDTLRVYLNSLERIGCEIKKGKKAEGSKYKIVKHPFTLRIPDEQIKKLITLYKTIIKNIDIEELIYLTNFFKKIANCIEEVGLKTTIENISPLTKLNKEILDDILNACKNQNEITITYNSPASGIKQIDVLPQSIKVVNNKVYLYGSSPNYKDTAVFLISKITQKPIFKLKNTIKENTNSSNVVYKLLDKQIPIENNEKILSEDETGYTVELSASNLFYARQRILYLGSDCIVISPESFKQDIIETLKKMRAEYAD